MSRYEIVVSKSAAKELSRLAKSVNNRIIRAILKLQQEPRPQGARKLRGSAATWRIRIGDYRVVYVIDDALRQIDIRKIGHRKDVYE